MQASLLRFEAHSQHSPTLRVNPKGQHELSARTHNIAPRVAGPPPGGAARSPWTPPGQGVVAGVGRRRAVHAEDPLGPASGHHGTLPGDAVKTCAVGADCLDLSGRRTFSRHTFCPADRVHVQ